jgi:hypothetical protein
MIRSIGIASLCAGLGYGVAGAAFAQVSPPMEPPMSRYALPGAPNYPLYEGRSVHRMSEPEAFYNESDEKGYRSGLPENPQPGQ